jgi:hypothetical protein
LGTATTLVAHNIETIVSRYQLEAIFDCDALAKMNLNVEVHSSFAKFNEIEPLKFVKKMADWLRSDFKNDPES